jgi:O-antigen ligase
VATAVVAAAWAGIAETAGASGLQVLLPIAAAVGLGLLWLAMVRFELFLCTMLVIRATLDAFKVGEGRSPFDPAALLSLLFLGAGTLWLVAQRRREPDAPSVPLAAPLAAFLGAATLSVATARDPVGSVAHVIRLSTVLILVLVLARLLVDARRIRLILTAVYGSAAVPVLFGLFELATGEGVELGGFTRVKSTFTHPNPLAIYLTILIVTGVALISRVRGIRLAAALPPLAAGLVVLVGTYTRSAWIAVVAGLLVVGILQSKRLVALMWVGLIAVVLIAPSTAARFQDLGENTRPSGQPANSLIWRFEYWTAALQQADNPVTGIGLGGVSVSTQEAKEPHNDFVRVFVETGLVGLAAYLWFCAAMVGLARQNVSAARTGLARGLGVGVAGAVTAFIVLSVVSNVLTQLVVLWYVAALATCAWAAGRLEAEPAPASP